MPRKLVISPEFNPPVEGGSKREAFQGGVVNLRHLPLPEAVFALKRESAFDPPSRGGWGPELERRIAQHNTLAKAAE